MKITFPNNKFGRTLNEYSRTIKKHGQLLADKIHQRFENIRAFRTLYDLIDSKIGRCHELKGKYEEHFGVSLTKNWRLIFKPDYTKEDLPRKTDGGIDIKKVDRIEVVSVEDYHE